MRFGRLIGLVAAVAVLAVGTLAPAPATGSALASGPGPGETTVLDTATGVTCTFTGSKPRRYLGMYFVAADPGIPLALIGLESHFVSATSAVYDDVRVRVQFWDWLNPALDPVFVQPAGPLQEISIGPRWFITNNAYAVTVQFPQPITFATSSYHGIAINIQGRVNGEYVDSDDLTPCLRLGQPFTVGTMAVAPEEYSFYRRDSGAEFNFSNQPRFLPGDYSGLMLKLFAQSAAITPTVSPTATPTPTAIPSATPTPTSTPGSVGSPRSFVPIVWP